jgi:hypothetical protein
MIAVAVALVIAMHVVAQRAAIVWRKLAVGLAAAGAVTGVLLVPVWLQYERLQRNPHFRRTPDPSSITDWRDYLTPASISRSLPDAPILGRFRPTDVEHQLFIGVVLGILAVIGLVVVVLKHREVQHRREALMLVAVGLVMLLLSGGDRGWLVGIDAPAPFRVARAVLSPFDGIRAPARFAVLVELAIAVLAVIALDRIAARSRRAFAVVAVVALCGIAVEARVAVPTVRLPDDRATTAVNHTLDRLPRGLTVELPIVAPSRGVAWPFIEAPRQYLARIDDQPRVNGYSGFDSPGFEAEAATLNTFPSAASIELMHRLGVRYVVLRHDPVGHLSADQRAAVLAQLPQLDGAAIDAALRSRPSWLAGSGRVGSSVLVRMATSRSS